MKQSVLFLLAIMATLSLNKAMAQFSLEATVTSMYDDNVNNNYLQLADNVTSGSLGLAYDWEMASNNTQLFYTGSLSYFSRITERSFHAHSFGLTHSMVLDEGKQSLLIIGGTYSLRLNRTEYSFYDNGQMSLYANVKHYLTERFLGRASYSFRVERLFELAEFNYTEHYGFLQGTFFLPTRTTVILEADAGTKIYSTPVYDTTVQTGTHGGGQRFVTASTPGVTQLTGIARIGQQVADGTGLSLTTSYQWNVQKESRYLSSDYTISDDELFDDHYGYEGVQTSLMVTQLLPADMRLRLSGTLQRRTYSDRPAYDLVGNQVADVRDDTRKVLTLLFEKRFDSPGFSLSLSYDYIINSSNDRFYNYTNNAVTLRVGYAY